MVSTIVKGMPYTTMTYEKPQTSSSRRKVLPTISSQIGLAADPIVDEKHSIDCSDGKSFTVNREIELFFDESDFTWLAFFSEPVRVQCVVDKNTNELQLQVVSYLDKSKNEDPLTIRVAMYKTCTSDQSPIYCHQEQMHPTALHLGQGSYGRILREHAHLYPGPDNGFDFVVNEKTGEIRHLFDWDVRDMTPGTRSNTSATQLIAFALPHHFDMFEQNPFDWTNEIYCAASLVGPSCLVEGSTWTLIDHVPDIDFRAPRSPESWALDALSKSLRQDLRFTLPHYFQLGAGDTYFSGKQLAKLGRVLLITEELKEMCHYGSNESICDEGMLPSDDDVNAAIASLRSSVQVWLDGTAITPFVYDSAWGGVASCGCHFDSKKKTCFNRFPECPAFSETGLNFGNAFYNDMHFHYGELNAAFPCTVLLCTSL